MSSGVQPLTGSSSLRLPEGHWATLLDCLCETFPAIGCDVWVDRFRRGRVLDDEGVALPASAPFRAHTTVHYFREVPNETPIPFEASILYADEHLVVADKPHFLPVVPAGKYVEQTLLRRLIRQLGNPQLVPLHRIDRATAGLVLFSPNPETRGQYQSLFRERRIEKRYLAVAPLMDPVPDRYSSRIERGEPFFRMCECPGPPNAETRIELCVAAGARSGYALRPVSGRKHQLRVHMAALGAPIVGDTLYPRLLNVADDDYSQPLQLLAEALAFSDPLTGRERSFRSVMRLKDWPAQT